MTNEVMNITILFSNTIIISQFINMLMKKHSFF